MKPEELEGAALDAAVAKALNDPRITMWGDSPWIDDGSTAGHGSSGRGFKPSTNWQDGGPIIERERIETWPHGQGWRARLPIGLDVFGPTPLIAAMRAFVVSKSKDQ